ncbi:hypothetical protein H5410_021943 [Solanum commersonii]|uniref:Uncharacterized protein n=1 Tax=Solanum commersonii TaxID=4109 RepID=A0A9J5ZIH0_SOLCO|nr:hypothetical protein H5410_021943 [Solanum commersonii]
MSCDMNSSNFNTPIDYFESLSEGCNFEIISKTTPANVVRSIILSKGFKFVAESDEIWGRFLPPDYQEIIDRFGFPLVYNTKKELFFRLCDSPILLDGGNLIKFHFDVSFFLDKHSGKKSFMIASREIIISDSNDAYSWQWVQRPNSSGISYRWASIGYSWNNRHRNVVTIDRICCLFGVQANAVHLPRLQESGDIPKLRRDGWMEVKLGYFDSKKGIDGPIEARLFEMNRIYKGGLIVEGVEFRPK